jgi:hypothetical protein
LLLESRFEPCVFKNEEGSFREKPKTQPRRSGILSAPQSIGVAATDMGPIYSYQFVIMLACAVFYYRAADIEDAPQLLWAGLSVLLYLLTWLWLGWGVLANLLAQVALLIGIAIVRVMRERIGR